MSDEIISAAKKKFIFIKNLWMKKDLLTRLKKYFPSADREN